MIHLQKIKNYVDYYTSTTEMENLVSFIVERADPFFLDILHQALVYLKEHQDYTKSFQLQSRRLVNRRREKVKETESFFVLLEQVLNLSNESHHYPRSQKPYS